MISAAIPDQRYFKWSEERKIEKGYSAEEAKRDNKILKNMIYCVNTIILLIILSIPLGIYPNFFEWNNRPAWIEAADKALFSLKFW